MLLVLLGFDLIDKVSIKSSEAILEDRKKNGLFTSFDDFCKRIAPRKANKRVKENLIWAGAFDNIPIVDENKKIFKQAKLI